MIYFEHSKTMFLHMPKTGGHYFRWLVSHLGIPHVTVRQRHGDHSDIEATGLEVKQSFSFVRHPCAWIKSYWCDRMRTGWGGELIIAHRCASNDFNDFVHNVIKYYPGFIEETMSRYIGPEHHRVFPQEMGITGMLQALDWAGVVVDPGRLHQALFHRRGETNASTEEWTRLAQFRSYIYAQLCVSERGLIDRYYS